MAQLSSSLAVSASPKTTPQPDWRIYKGVLRAAKTPLDLHIPIVSRSNRLSFSSTIPQDHLSMNPSILPGVAHSKQLPGGWKRGRQPVCLLVFVLSSTAPKLPSLRPPSSTKHRQECQHRIEPANSQGNLASCKRTPTSCNQSSPVSVSAVCLVRLVQHIVQSSKCVSWPICFSSDK